MPKAALALIVLLALVASGIRPYDRATWIMEVAPVLIAAPILGGAYTYARVPLGFWPQEWLGFERNPYDRIGHLMQGFVPALVAREILLRRGYVAGRRMAAFLSVCVALAISASYELIEWWSALALGQGADDFLGTQGDPWDTQSDMFCALIGAVLSVLLLSKLQDRQIRALNARPIRL